MTNELVVKPLELSTIEPLLAKMDDALNQARKDTEELAVTAEQAQGMEYADLKRFRTELNRSRKACNEARIAFKNAWQAPMKQVEGAFNAELSGMDAAIETIKGELDARDAEFKEQRYEELANAWQSLLEDNGLESLAANVDFGRILDPKWLNRSNHKYMDELTEKTLAILKDYEAVNKGTWAAGLDEALRCFFETLSLREVMDNDPKAYDLQLARHDLAVATDQPSAQPAPGEEPEQPEPAEEEKAKYSIRCELTKAQLDGVVDYLRAIGAHGRIMRVG